MRSSHLQEDVAPEEWADLAREEMAPAGREHEWRRTVAVHEAFSNAFAAASVGDLVFHGRALHQQWPTEAARMLFARFVERLIVSVELPPAARKRRSRFAAFLLEAWPPREIPYFYTQAAMQHALNYTATDTSTDDAPPAKRRSLAEAGGAASAASAVGGAAPPDHSPHHDQAETPARKRRPNHPRRRNAARAFAKSSSCSQKTPGGRQIP